MTSAEASLHLRYSAWASRKLVEAVRSIPDADLEKPVGISHNSLLGTLAHIAWGDWLWLSRVVGPMEKPGQTREALETEWPALQEKYISERSLPTPSTPSWSLYRRKSRGMAKAMRMIGCMKAGPRTKPSSGESSTDMPSIAAR